MANEVYTFKLAPAWDLINKLTSLDKFGGLWVSIEKSEGRSLKELKSIATVRSVGASTRIEGSQIKDAEVEVLIKNFDVSKLNERDKQEVAGYYEVLDDITNSFRDINITENHIKQLHNNMMRYSEKDQWHKGNYKQHSNVVEAAKPDGGKYVIFQTTAPGIETEDAMRKLIEWYNSGADAHPVIRIAAFVYDFLSIHPFQDGNGRLSRLLTTLLLLRHGYSWIQYVSFEHEVENRKGEYYQVLMQCQRQRPGEDVYPWMIFFLDCLNNIQNSLMDKLEAKGNASRMSVREKKIYSFIESRPGCQSAEIAERLAIPLPTVKRVLAGMIEKKYLIKHGIGSGTNYTILNVSFIKTDLMFTLTNTERKKEFMLMNPASFIEIKKILLNPKFEWIEPDDWGTVLHKEALRFKISVAAGNNRVAASQPYSIAALNSPYLYKPVFSFHYPISIPMSATADAFHAKDYPLQVIIELLGSVDTFTFDVNFVYDAAID